MDFNLHDGIAVLERTPQTVRSMLAGLPPAWTDATDGPETWSPFVIVGHLIHGERTDWIPRARIILEQGPDRRFTPYDRFAQFRESQGKSLADVLDEFADLRARNLATLAEWRLGNAQLALQGEHPEFGAVTLRQLLATWVAHDLGHIAQAARVMARQYREGVGPWSAYLPIVGPTGPLSTTLIGTWELLSREDRAADGTVRVDPSLGADPVAMLIYDRAGHFAAQFMKRDRRNIEETPVAASGANNSRARGGYDAYFGNYRVDDAHGTVTQTLTGALSAENVGHVLTRAMQVEGSELTIRLETNSSAGEAITRTLRWRRVA